MHIQHFALCSCTTSLLLYYQGLKFLKHTHLAFHDSLHKGHLSKSGKKTSTRRQIKLSQTNYSPVISGYFVNIKDPRVPVF